MANSNHNAHHAINSDKAMPCTMFMPWNMVQVNTH